MTELNFHQLRIFSMVAQLGSFSRAARKLEISQPAVSAQVRQLEEELGLVLIDRANHRVGLTEAGRSIAGYAERIFAMSEELLVTADRLRNPPRARLLLGASPTIGTYVLPAFFARFRRTNPDVQLELRIAPARAIVERLLVDEIGIGFVANEASAPDIAVYPFGHDVLLAVAAPGHPLGGRPTVSPAELRSIELIQHRSGSSTRRAIDARFAELGETPRVVMELENNETIKQAVIAGLGVALLSRAAVGAEIDAGRLVSVGADTLSCQRHFYYLVRRSRQVTDVQREFLELLRQHERTELAS
jgi:DNA-binding transcriptional LysR family regulator